MNEREYEHDAGDEFAAGLVALIYGIACALFGVAAHKLWMWIF